MSAELGRVEVIVSDARMAHMTDIVVAFERDINGALQCVDTDGADECPDEAWALARRVFGVEVTP